MIKSADWNAQVTVIKATGSNMQAVGHLGSGNTYLQVDATNNKVYIYIAGTKVAEWG